LIKNYPAIKITLLFCCGIVIEKIFSFGFYFSLSAFAVLGIAAIIIFNKTNHESQNHYVRNVLIFALLILLGMMNYSVNKPVELSGFRNYKIKSDKIYGTVESIELPRRNNIDFVAKIDSIKIHSKSIFVGKKFLVKSSAPNNYRKLKNVIDIGDSFILSGYIQKARNARNPNEFDYRNYLFENDIYGIIHYKEIHFHNTTDLSFMNIIKNIRFGLFNQINKLYKDDNSALINGLLLAFRKNMDYDLIERFINSGVVHVLAVSGLHVGFITFIFLFLFSRFNIYLKYSFTIIGLIIFAMITNLQPSVVRATIMAVSVIAGFFFSRKYNSYNSISLAALIILLFNPNDLFNPGFQLSFSAVLSIITFYPPISKKINEYKINGIIRNLLLFTAVSLSAQIGTLPFTLLYFHKLSVVALFANMFVIPMIGIIVGLSIVSVAVSYLSLTIGNLFANTNNLLIDFLYFFVKKMGDPQYSVINISSFSLFDSLLFYFLLSVGFLIFINHKNLKYKLIIVFLLFANFIIWEKTNNMSFQENGKLKVMMIDIGQGDSFLIGFPDGKIALIDAGARNNNFDNGQRIIFPLLRNYDIEKIDFAFVSHVDNDHYGGFSSLIKNIRVENIFKPRLNSKKIQDVTFEKEIHSAKINLTYYHDTIIKGSNYRIYILNNPNLIESDSEGENDKSGIIKIHYGNTCFLFVGDAGISLEDKLIKYYGTFLKSDVLKVGHHGSKHSTSEEFLKSVKPAYSLISVGEYNTFGHPAKRVIDLLNSYKVHSLRTDELGASLLVSDGNKIFINKPE